jgi:hypothetical protein
MSGESFALGAFTKLWLEPGTTTKTEAAPTAGCLTFDGSSEAYDFLAESLARKRTFIGGREIRGTRVGTTRRRRVSHYDIGGDIVKYISPLEMNNLIPKFLGAEGGADVFSADEDIPYFSALLQRDSTVFSTASDSIFRYDNCKLDKFILRGRATGPGEDAEPQMVTATLRIIACSQVEVALPSPISAIDQTVQSEPYIFADSDTFASIGGVTCPIEEFVILVDNDIEAKYVNSLLPYALRPRDRNIRLRFRIPWNDTTDALYDSAAAGIACTFKLATNAAAYSTYFEFGALQVDDVTPTASRGKGQLEFVLDATALRNATNTYDLRITNDVTT